MDQIKFLGKKLGLFKKDTAHDPIGAAQTALSSRAADEFCALTDKLIAINGLKGKGVRKELLARMQTDWNVKSAVPPAPAAVIGAVGTGAAGGLASDLATGGLSLGLGTLIGTVVGALGGAGLAVAYNRKQAVDGTIVIWSRSALMEFLQNAVLLYLAIAHFGRGRGNWALGESPIFWKTLIANELTCDMQSQDPVPKIVEHLLKNTLKNLYPKSRF